MDCVKQLMRVLQVLYNTVVSRTVRTCRFFPINIDYLGHFIQPGRLDLAKHTTDASAKL